VIGFERHRTMDADAHIAPVAVLVADSTRSTILFALSDGRSLPACELAALSGVTAATISYHLEKLIGGGLVSAEKQGRHRYYCLANPSVIGLLETLATLAPPAPRSGSRRRDGRGCVGGWGWRGERMGRP